MDSRAPGEHPPEYRTPYSAIAFGVIIVGLVLSYLFVAFVYGHGWSDLLTDLLGLGVIVVWIAFWSFMIWQGSRGSRATR